MLKSIVKYFKMNSLSRQLLAGFIMILLAVLILTGIYQYFFMKEVFYGKAEELLQSRLHNVSIGELIEINTGDQLKEKAPSLIEQMIDTNVSIAVIGKTGLIIADSENGVRTHYGRRLMQEEDESDNLGIDYPILTQEEYISLNEYPGILEGVRITQNQAGENFMIQMSKVGDPGNGDGLIQLSTSMVETEALLTKNLMIFIFLTCAAFLVSLLLIRKLLNYTLGPLGDFTKTIEEISSDQLSVRLPETGTQIEMERLTLAFNKMLERLEESFKKELEVKEKMRRFLSDASHELKTPITSIQGFAEVLAGGAAKDEEELKASLWTIQKESERLTRLLNNLLSLSRLDRQAPREMAPLRIDEVLEEIYPQLKLMAGKRELTLSIEGESLMNGNEDQIRQLIINLIQNAVQHTEEEGGQVKIGLRKISSEGKILKELCIEDNGTGIPEEDLGHIFDRFYRAEKHRSRESGGEGLGLAIVKEIIQQHGGEIQVFSTLGTGTRFVILF